MADSPFKTESTITCPHCRYKETLPIPDNYCLARWQCPSCGEELKPYEGDCCVFCSFGDVPCLPIQQENLCWEGHGMCCAGEFKEGEG